MNRNESAHSSAEKLQSHGQSFNEEDQGAPRAGQASSSEPSFLRRVFVGFFHVPRHPNPEKRSKWDTMTIISIRVLLVLAILAVIIVPSATLTEQRGPKSKTSQPDQSNVTYTGACNGDICKWSGVRYAQPPIGDLRFARTQPLKPNSGNILATHPTPQCPQDGSDAKQDEDCLHLDIYAPRRFPKGVQRLPVLAFFHGGGFQAGDKTALDATKMVEAGSASGLPTIIVSINYRLGLLGFLAGTEILDRQRRNHNDVSLNNGFHDMAQAISWLKSNIERFDGDPERITIWGQSAGSFGVGAQLLKNPSKPPFVGAILESGSPGGVPIDPATSADDTLADVLKVARCDTADDHIDCLRRIDWRSLRDISVDMQNKASMIDTVPRGFYLFKGVIDDGPTLGGFFSAKPSDVINGDMFAPVPLLHGDCSDEGTIFATHESKTDQDTKAYFKRLYFDGPDADKLLDDVLRAYPDDPAQGSPYRPENGVTTDRYYGPTNQFKRVASLYGDIRYHANRRLFLSAAARRDIPVYSYQFAQDTPGGKPTDGVSHGSDLPFVKLSQHKNPFGNQLALQWLAFTAYQDPSRGLGLPKWPLYQDETKQMLLYQGGITSTTQDTFREEQMAVLNRPDVLQSSGR